jgi:serine/threonine protein kinase
MPYQVGDEPIRGYKLVRLLGRGRRGEVWQSAHISGVTAAIKIIRLNDQDARGWLPAIFEIKNIRHPHVLEINRTWLRDTEGNAFGLTQARPLPGWELLIVMDLVGNSLARRLDECLASQGQGIPRPELMNYLREAAKALDFLGGQGIVHGGVSPHNLLLHGGKVKVSDAGHAWMFGPAPGDQNAFGSAVYSPPESARRGWCRASDQYSLGVCYYQLLTAKLPQTKAASASEIQHAELKVPLAGDLSERELAVFTKGTHVDPGQRYPSAAAFVEALQHAQAAAPPRWESGAFHRPV